MPIYRLAVLLLATLLTLPGQCCQTYIEFGHSSVYCAFHVTYNDTTCFNFIWGHCSYNDGQHVNSNSWNRCTQKCCDEDVSYPQNWDGIRQCQDYLDKKMITLVSLFVGIFGGIPTIAVLAILINIIYRHSRGQDHCCRNRCTPCCCHCNCNCRCCLEQRVPSSRPHVGTVQIMEPSTVFVETGWTKVYHTSNLRESCCICLQSGISLELECGHVFHRQCIVAWLRKKKACALCRSQELGTVKTYCEKCFSYSRNTTLLDNLDSLEFNRQLCSNCR